MGSSTVVVGLPVKLDGSASAATARAVEFVKPFGDDVPVVILTEDERLTSHEAESRSPCASVIGGNGSKARHAAAAAIILQDYLDRRG